MRIEQYLKRSLRIDSPSSPASSGTNSSTFERIPAISASGIPLMTPSENLGASARNASKSALTSSLVKKQGTTENPRVSNSLAILRPALPMSHPLPETNPPAPKANPHAAHSSGRLTHFFEIH